MIHYTCDHCGVQMAPDRDARYEVKIEVRAACDPREIGDDSHVDLEADVCDLLEMMQGVDASELQDEVFRKFHFDLCAECKDSYLVDPLFRARVRTHLGYFEN